MLLLHNYIVASGICHFLDSQSLRYFAIQYEQYLNFILDYSLGAWAVPLLILIYGCVVAFAMFILHRTTNQYVMLIGLYVSLYLSYGEDWNSFILIIISILTTLSVFRSKSTGEVTIPSFVTPKRYGLPIDANLLCVGVIVAIIWKFSGESGMDIGKNQLGLLAALLVVYVFCRLDGIGQHSGFWMSYVPLLAIMALSLLFIPAVMELATKMLHSMAVKEVLGETPAQERERVLQTNWMDDKWASLMAWIWPQETRCSFARMVLGYIFMGAMAADEIRGPTSALRAVSKGISGEVTSGWAMNANSAWLVSLLFEVLFVSTQSGVVRIGGMLSGLTLGYILQGGFMNRLWTGRGSQLLAAKLKENLNWVVGDGPLGGRSFMLMALNILVMFTHFLGGEWQQAYITLAACAMPFLSDRISCIILGWESGVVSIAIMCLRQDPVNEAAKKNSISNSVGANAGQEERNEDWIDIDDYPREVWKRLKSRYWIKNVDTVNEATEFVKQNSDKKVAVRWCEA